MAGAWQTEKKRLDFLNSIDEEVKSSKGDLDRRITENLDQWRGKQWKSSKSPTFLYNIIESCLEEKSGKLSETKPQIQVLPAYSGLGNAAEVLTKVTESIWDRQSMEYKTERIAIWASLAGAAFVGTIFNPRRQDVDLLIKDPRACGIDISCTSGEDADFGEYATFEDFVALDIIRHQYPGRGALITPDERINGFDVNTDKTVAQRIQGVYSRLWQKIKPEKVSAIPKAIIREYYIQDRRESINDDGVVPACQDLTNYNETGLPFPGGRRIIRAGDIVLEDGPNPYWDGLYPIDMMSWKIDPETAWGADEVQGVKRMQEGINRLGDAWTKTALVNAVVRVVMDAGALSPTERNKLSNEVGQIIEKNPGRALEYQVPPLLSMDVLNFVNMLMGWTRTKMGVQQPPTQNRVPSIITGPAIEGLQMMIETPIRTSARRIEEFYQRIGQKLISRIFQYYTSDKILPLVGPDTKWMQFEFRRMGILTNKQGKARVGEDLQKAFRDFHFTIAPGSSLAITRQSRAMMKAQLVQMGLIHPREILIELGIPNPDEKIEDAKKAKENGLFDVMMGQKSGLNLGVLGGGGGGGGDQMAA